MAGYRDGVVRSDVGLSLAFRAGDAFLYSGSFTFDLSAGARVERHLFVDGTPRIRRMVVIHFEMFLDGVADRYRYALRDAVALGGETYGRSASVLSVAEERASSPGAEMARTAEFLSARGLTLPDRHAVARYARIVGDDQRREILIFYHEAPGSLEGIYERAQRAFELAPRAAAREDKGQ